MRLRQSSFSILILILLTLVGPPPILAQSDTPEFDKFLANLPLEKTEPVPSEFRRFTERNEAYITTIADWKAFFSAAVSDKLTNLRAFALLGKFIQEKDVMLFHYGNRFESAVRESNVDLGLALPVYGMAFILWTPIHDESDPDRSTQIKVIYWKAFEHEFQPEILPATLKIGIGDDVPFTMNEKSYVGKVVDTDLYCCDGEIGLKDIQGIGGRKHGILGVFQRVLFFLPDAISAMVINPKGQMITRALINTTIDNFETQRKYQIHKKE